MEDTFVYCRSKSIFATYFILQYMASNIAQLFNLIAPKYDFLNHLLSFNIDKLWRKKAIRNHFTSRQTQVLDVACGTGDFALQIHKAGVAKVVGVDISSQMVEFGRKKIAKKGLTEQIDLKWGDVARLDYPSDYFDGVSVAFGVRNFEDRKQGLSEIYRVLKPEAELIVLEFSTPQRGLMKPLYRFYFKHLLPLIGGWISGDRKAYDYLPNSVYAFPQGQSFLDELEEAGFRELSFRRMSMGIATVYYAKK